MSGRLQQLFVHADASGRVPGNVGRAWLRGIPDAPSGDLARDLGPFEDLMPAVQSAIREVIRQRDARWVRGHQPGPLYLALVRALFALRSRLNASKGESRVVVLARQVADALAFGARRAPSELIRRFERLSGSLSVRFGRSVPLLALLDAAGVDVRPLAVCYARQLAQPEEYRGYWHDPAARQTVGIAAGIDFLPTEEGLRFIECNINFGQRAERSALYESDPYVENLLDFAVEHGYRRLVVVDSAANGIDPATARRLEQGARKRALALTLVDRESVPHSAYLRRYRLPALETRNTLLVRTRSYPITLDYVADMKQASVSALGRYLQVRQELDLLLPESGSEPVLGQVGPHEPFPNVVFKFPEIDQGRGVYFLKADSPEHARSIIRDAIRAGSGGSFMARLERMIQGHGGIYQAYYRSRMRPDRKLYKLRAHVLITPVGVRFLSAHRIVSGHAVPARLPSGVITNPAPFMVNYSGGSSRYELVPADEALAVSRAAEAVGRGLAWAFEYGFRVG
jgi:hypothetical protein